MINYTTPFSYLFTDKNWFRKFALASLLTYTLIGAEPVFGWTIEIARRVAQGRQPVIPDWDDWKSYWKTGGKFTIVNAVWLLPILIIVIPLYLPVIFDNSLPKETLVMSFGASLCCSAAFLIFYFIAFTYFYPAMMAELARNNSVGKAMNPIHLWKVTRPHSTEYLIVFFLVGIVLSNVVLLVGALTLFLLLPPLLVYSGLVIAHFAGQLGSTATT